MCNFTMGNWRLEDTMTSCKRIVCDTVYGNTVPIAVVHHQTFQKGVNPVRHGSGLPEEIMANAQLLLNAEDMYYATGKVYVLLQYLLSQVEDGDSLSLTDFKLKIARMVDECGLFKIYNGLSTMNFIDAPYKTILDTAEGADKK